MKFYARDFENTKYKNNTGKVWVKFGKTHHGDAEKRFDKNVDDGYEKNYDDWKGSIAFSWNKLIGKQSGPKDPKKELYLTQEQVSILEDHILTKVFPNPGPTKVWVEQVLGCKDNNEYKKCSGITELRLLTVKQRKWILKQLYSLRDGDYKYLQGEMKALPKLMGLPRGRTTDDNPYYSYYELDGRYSKCPNKAKKEEEFFKEVAKLREKYGYK